MASTTRSAAQLGTQRTLFITSRATLLTGWALLGCWP